jgi:hypothetical protein
MNERARDCDDLVELRWKPLDLDILWHNPQVASRRASPLPLPHSGRSEFYDTFHGGWLLSLPAGFFPCDYFGAPLGMLGEFCQLPWEASASPGYAHFRTTGVRTPFSVSREVMLSSDSPDFEIVTRVRNHAGTALPLAWVEHALFGGEFIVGSSVYCSAAEVVVTDAGRPEHAQLNGGRHRWPMVRQSSGGMRDCRIIPAPGSADEHLVVLESWQRPMAGIWNPGLEVGFQLEWDAALLPKAWVWAAGQGGKEYPLWGRAHVVGIEPANVLPIPFQDVLGSLPLVEPGADLETRLTGRFVTAFPSA